MNKPPVGIPGPVRPALGSVMRSIKRLILLAIAAGMAVVGAGACSSVVPIAPHPTHVVVPYPDNAPATMDWEEIREMYTVSPIVNPDGLGDLETVRERSYMTLVPWEAERQVEEVNRVAYARTPDEQREVLIRGQAFYENNVTFEGLVMSDHDRVYDFEFYTPEGIYLLDDKGEKFYPLEIEDRDPLIASELEIAYNEVVFAGGPFGWWGETLYIGFPRIMFPGHAITKDTRAVTLYLAVFRKRMAFTWIFDPTYMPPAAPREKRRRLQRSGR